jgi:hypothetical protein
MKALSSWRARVRSLRGYQFWHSGLVKQCPHEAKDVPVWRCEGEIERFVLARFKDMTMVLLGGEGNVTAGYGAAVWL